mmetsp:Transcript_39201/g.80302  ORF Transcript_39201/g.80302 Transcript_39201/m.80302 type:complete len:207 (-) Transcript_39201:294-914(-)
MWKPGTDAPPSRSRSPSRSPPPGGPASSTDNVQTPKNKSPKKRLSSGTMGMRFMKRKVEAEEAAKKQAAEEEKARGERKAMEWSAAGTAGGGDDGEAMSEDDAVAVPLSATAADVYGIGASVIGRRSFGDFNKVVQETWNEAVERTARERSGARAERQQITDEELLERYEKYVKHGDSMGNGKSASIGNLQKKRKKKKDRGEKRKR